MASLRCADPHHQSLGGNLELACLGKTRSSLPMRLHPDFLSTLASFPSAASRAFLLPDSICCYCCQLLHSASATLDCC